MRKAQFVGTANFENTTFYTRPLFNGAIFNQKADFEDANFGSYAHFSGTTFEQEADFEGAKFNKTLMLGKDTTFGGEVDFENVRFSMIPSLNNGKFDKRPDFTGACFTDNRKLSESDILDMFSALGGLGTMYIIIKESDHSVYDVAAKIRRIINQGKQAAEKGKEEANNLGDEAYNLLDEFLDAYWNDSKSGENDTNGEDMDDEDGDR